MSEDGFDGFENRFWFHIIKCIKPSKLNWNRFQFR